jgi:hypothetical protein
VFAHEERVKDDEVDLFVHPEVASEDAVVLPAAAHIASGHLNQEKKVTYVRTTKPLSSIL